MGAEGSDRDFSPMLYDVMRELATQLSGRYVEWMDQARSDADEAHWRAEHLRVMREARAVDPDSRSAIEEHTAKLRAALADMPLQAPVLT
ncbi:hypothetical protein [Propionibacterium australiense]|uniref:Uncharacterized protein n=2 Tax=Propionibacterium australiense TaxID=119981 RepID=A0A383S8J9_9ACTN|nr:hypothetical protein [Propionibacterium australiense]RLP07177.1 hypothetical protein D9T14_10535 [Propionibacterium australiense]RLP07535.1 hypothetical protein D7U36_11035 [Propionibacterium australiense]SYZ34153.1 Hypothetical protein PROPAUS_2155 [Propionibacterium australiense]VEH92572.1 Uncharacterised protein [Propionibacterium australiense]